MKATQSTVVSPTARQRWTRMRPLVIIIFLGLLFVIATALIPRYEKDSETLSPNNPGNSGAQALVQTLRHHGIKVVKVTSARELIARSTPDSTAVITYPGYMPDATAKAIDEKVHRVVYLLSHYGSDLDTPSVEVTTSKTTNATETLSAECTSEPAQKAQTLLNNSGQLVTTTEVGWTKCFPADDAYAYLEKNEGDHFRAIIADGAIASNQWVDSDGNAALLINAMAQKPTIYWYDGSKDNVLASDTVDTLEPQWLIPILSLIGIGITVIGFSRGQRLGRLVPEDLPSYVPSSETTKGRGRLMATQKQHAHAARLLRIEAVTTIAKRLGIDPKAPRATLEHALAARGLLTAQVSDLLWGPPPTNNSELVELAEALSALTQEIEYQ